MCASNRPCALWAVNHVGCRRIPDSVSRELGFVEVLISFAAHALRRILLLDCLLDGIRGRLSLGRLLVSLIQLTCSVATVWFTWSSVVASVRRRLRLQTARIRFRTKPAEAEGEFAAYFQKQRAVSEVIRLVGADTPLSNNHRSVVRGSATPLGVRRLKQRRPAAAYRHIYYPARGRMCDEERTHLGGLEL
jgi:hypothetical protein